MEDNKFFKTIWRFNGVIISLIGVAILALLLFASYKAIEDFTQDRHKNNIVNLDANNITEDITLGGSSKITGTSVFKIPMYGNQSYEGSYFSKHTNSEKNYLFINVETSEKHWLFNHTDYLLSNVENITEDASGSPVLAIMYNVVKQDSNLDKRLTNSDLITLAFTKPSGKGYIEILSDIDNIVSTDLMSNKDLFVVYKIKEVYFSLTVNLETFIIRNKEKLPLIGSK